MRTCERTSEPRRKASTHDANQKLQPGDREGWRQEEEGGGRREEGEEEQPSEHAVKMCARRAIRGVCGRPDQLADSPEEKMHVKVCKGKGVDRKVRQKTRRIQLDLVMGDRVHVSRVY